MLSIQAPVDAEVNHAHTCLKGRFAFKFYNHKDRLRKPLIRQSDGSFKESTWDEAYDVIVALPAAIGRIIAGHSGRAESSSVSESEALGAACCPKCGQRALIRKEGCDACLECGHSKCG